MPSACGKVWSAEPYRRHRVVRRTGGYMTFPIWRRDRRRSAHWRMAVRHNRGTKKASVRLSPFGMKNGARRCGKNDDRGHVREVRHGEAVARGERGHVRGDGFVFINMVQFANFLKRCMKSLKNSFGNDILLWIETSRMDDGPRMRGGQGG